MKTIHQLPENVIAKIAAGEVIERPAYAVKELIENAIDADADSITIHIEEGGLKRIVVIDNGKGMSIEDLQECYKPHTTSKLSKESQLDAIQTLGFRGEALSSIAAVSNMTIRSKRLDEVAGTIITLRASKLISIAPVGTPTGTSITVDSLFYTVPARKKFLKSAQTEFRQILDIITHEALSYPGIRITVTHNDRTILDLPKTRNKEDRLSLILGKEFLEQSIPVSFENSYIKIEGIISKPQYVSSSQHKQFLSVNNRSVSDKLINLAVKEAYSTLIAATSYPQYYLSLQVPFEVVDVNVHPRKEQISFVNKEMLFETVRQAVSEALNAYTISYDWKDKTEKKSQTRTYAGQALKQLVLSDAARLVKPEDKSDLVQLHNLYIFTQSQKGIAIIDQHAAHERILYEKLSAEFKEQHKKQEQYTLPQPFLLELPVTDAEILSEHLDIFTSLGFRIKVQKTKTFLITEIPDLFKDRNYVKLIRELLDDIRQEKPVHTIDRQSKRMLAFLACRAAVKAGDPLTKDQQKNLLEELQKTPNNETCPHGRPVQINLSLPELHKMFKRS